MPRAQGARSQLAAAFEAAYGTAPAGGFIRMPFASSTLGSEQPLLASELLGFGRDPLAPVRDAISAGGELAVPIDADAFGVWLKAAFGAPVTSNTKAAGSILFAANPEDGDSITLGGTRWTFVESGAAGNETEIESTLAATLGALAVDLNNAVDGVITGCSYAVSGGNRLEITFKADGTGGNRFAIAASDETATLSGATLSGGACRHEFRTGAWDLPSLSIEIGLPEVPRFALYTGVMLDQLAWTMQRAGLLTATATLMAQGETIFPATQAGTPGQYGLTRFGHFNGSVLRNGMPIGNVVSAQVSYANNLDRIETIRNDGMIDGADPSVAALTGSLEARFADLVLLQQAHDGSPCTLEFGHALPTGDRLTLTAHAVYLPRPRLEISGPQGIQASFDWQAARDPWVERMATITLVNNTPGY